MLIFKLEYIHLSPLQEGWNLASQPEATVVIREML